MSNEFVNELPPQNIDAEKAVLGSIFLSTDALVESMEFLEPDDFYKHAHQIIYKDMVELNDRDEAIDVVTITNILTEQNNLEDVGGMEYIADLAGSVPTAANVTYYAKIVKDKAILRRLIQTATNIVTNSYNTDDDVTTVLDDAERDIMNVAENRTQSGFKPIKEVLNNAFNEIDRLSQEGDAVTGLSTGYPELDKITTGLHSDELVILAARPAVGKTAFALNLAQNVGTKTDKTVAIFSLEMSAESLVNRMLCAEGSIDANHLRTGQLTEDEWQNLVVAMGSLSRANIYMDDTAGIKMSEIRAKCRRLAKETGNLGLVVVDYLQLIEGSNAENRQQEVSGISRQLKKLAKELHVPVIALSQLSRGVEQRQDKRPVLSDIRESGSIEQDADIVAFLYRDDYYRDEDDDSDDSGSENEDDENNVGEVEVIIEKNRSGPRGTVKLLFVKSYNKFSSISYAQQQ
ncbi:replicative DNA helicase [Lentilactobacillus parabuchneri]|jgi:replicative DNA helicase|uniref:Replicative DNA helicase n=2 Tax=Lentilactobacillus parabuchneri TaxID=152331 RepID=A0A1X1FFM9_9LACO|nr:replicative DNA helicase [Lentilactobacillus parabuchneri]APR07210.1 Replicative DNA helicase [Lentilactobacillus parabuchneri]KRM47432.1 replicative DNA helicase [Lentilactobacillus parabuchneri DSM 5707 = NBRC 107865]KRN79880.1 replicative DNA helicase [Lentilactobacillus parabuchneri]MBW0222767.1 replicative DNA helicase [Lentilactobacillus parabuchneri]MBW0245256.1 replicative DNA helicase [Lentilactobacillus parabuchneri]